MKHLLAIIVAIALAAALAVILLLTSCLPDIKTPPEKIYVKPKISSPPAVDLSYCKKHNDTTKCPRRCASEFETLLDSKSTESIISYSECMEFGRVNFWHTHYKILQQIIDDYNSTP